MVSEIFTEREKTFENKFALDEKTEFEIHARAVKMFGMWAAAQFGMAKRDAENYAEKMLENDVEKPNDIVAKVRRDFETRKIEVSERLLHNQFSVKLQQSRLDILSDRLH